MPLEKIKRIKKPVYLLNDCGAAVLGEKHFGAGKGLNNLVYVTLSSGIGGGAMVDGHLLSGERGNAVEIGHLVVETSYNLKCGCGKGQGHWEGYGSGESLPKFFKFWLKKKKRKLNFKVSTAKDIFEAAKKKKRLALAFVEELAKINARAVSDIIVAYEPVLITLGGAVALNNQSLILRLKKYVDHYLKIPEIRITPLGEEAVLYGGLAMVFEKKGFRL